MTETNVFEITQPGTFSDPLTEVFRNGARTLLGQAVEAEVAAWLSTHTDKLTDDGRRRLVRHGHLPEREIVTGIGAVAVRCPRVRDRVGEGGGRIRFFVGDYVCDHAHGPMRGQRVCAGLLAYPELDDALGVIEAIQFGRGDYFADRPQFPVDRGMANRRSYMNKQAKIKAQMASFDKLIQDLDTRYHLGPEAGLLAQETLGLITGRPGGIGSFVNRFKAAGFAVEVASWLGGPDPVPLSGQEVEQTLGSDVISGIANKIGVSQIFARTILGYAIPEVIVLLAQGGAIPLAIRAWAASFRDSAIHSSTPINEITQHRAEQIRPSRTEHSGAAAGLRPLLIPGASLLITLGLLLGYFIGAGDRGAIQSAPIVAQNAPVASPHVPSIPARLALHNENGLIAYSGTVGDDATRSSITDSLKTLFGAQKITGDLSVDLNAGPAHWAKGFKAALDNFKISGLRALFEGNAASVGGAIPEADRDRIMSSLKSVLGPQFAFATIAGSSTPTASSALTSGFSVENPIGDPNRPTLNLPTIYFATNSAEVPSDTKVLVQQAAGLMKQLPAGTTVRISGYTDSVGTQAANMRLSQRRANAVRQVLVDAGVNPAMLSAKGYGSLHSLASKNGTTEGRSISTIEDRLRKDRRVEFSVAQ